VVSAQYDQAAPTALAQVVAKDTLWARAFRRRKMAPPPASIIVIDEAHKSMARTWQAVAEHYKDSVVVGVTATPCRQDGKGLGAFYTHLVQLATYQELQEQGFLVPCRVWVPDRPDLKGLKVSNGDYQKGDLQKRMDQGKLVGNIVREWRRRGDGRVTIAFASGVNHSIHIRNEFRDAGVVAEHLDGKTPWTEREDIVGRLRDGRIDVLCNYGVATTGLDAPIAKALILARPTKSFGLFRQMCGRIMRPYPGYTDAVIIDHAGCAERFGFPDEDVEWDLSDEIKIQEKHERQKRERKKEDYRCEKCTFLYRGPRCPNCGHRPERAPKRVNMTKGELRELGRREANKRTSNEDKVQYWKYCLGWAVGNSRKVGAAAHMYREQFGVWPKNVPRLPHGRAEWRMNARDFYNLLAERGDL
jgi:superfamily II DNA or RNA helicase